LVENGIGHAIDQEINWLNKTGTYELKVNNQLVDLQITSPDKDLIILRLLQEIINNIIKHAEASLIQIRLQSDAEHIVLSVIDNGKGFNLTSNKKGQGFNNITNRAALFNGKAEIEAAPGMGCSLTVIIPLDDN
jgi:signal transduction histidine kinase